MKISLCMITKNEENLIDDCLKSVKNHVDEIIIVDTGSTDNTCNIALNYGAKIYHIKWENNFSKARNFGINRAKGDWILYLDADEILENGELLKELIKEKDENINGFIFNILNYSDEKKQLIEHSQSVRLFRNKADMRFMGAIHEQLPIKDKGLAMTDLVIHHYGYIPSISKVKEKSKRNLKILQEEINNKPNDSFVHYNLGSEFLRLNQFDKAIDYYKKALELIDEDTGYESRLYKMLGLSYVAVKKYHEAVSVLNEGITKFVDYPDLYYVRGVSFNAINDYDNAISDLLKCLFLDKQYLNNNHLYAIEEGVTSFKAQYLLGLIYFRLEKYKEAIKYFSQVEKHNERSLDALAYLISSLWIKGSIQQAKKLLINSLSPMVTYQKVTKILLQFANDKLEKCLAEYTDNSLIQNKYKHIQEVIKNVQKIPNS